MSEVTVHIAFSPSAANQYLPVSEEMAILPLGYRPPYRIAAPCTVSSGVRSAASMDILEDGRIILYSEHKNLIMVVATLNFLRAFV